MLGKIHRAYFKNKTMPAATLFCVKLRNLTSNHVESLGTTCMEGDLGQAAS
jgi:hypothetical protein